MHLRDHRFPSGGALVWILRFRPKHRSRVIRDGGMFERREAPQFYSERKRAKNAPA
jgi:hypothetical protein